MKIPTLLIMISIVAGMITSCVDPGDGGLVNGCDCSYEQQYHAKVTGLSLPDTIEVRSTMEILISSFTPCLGYCMSHLIATESVQGVTLEMWGCKPTGRCPTAIGKIRGSYEVTPASPGNYVVEIIQPSLPNLMDTVVVKRALLN